MRAFSYGYGIPRGGGRGSADPRAISGLRMFFIADKGITIGTGVSAWADQSGNGNDLSQGTGSAQPALVSSWRNGRNALQGAASKWIGRASLVTPVNGAMSALIVVETPAAFGASEFLFGSSVGGEKYCRNATNVLKLGASSDAGTLAMPTSTACVLYAEWTASGTNGTARVLPHGGTVLSETNLATGTANLTQMGVLDLHGGAVPWKGKIAALAVYNRSMSIAERTQLESWAKTYYGIAPL